MYDLISRQDAIDAIGKLLNPIGGTFRDADEKKLYDNGVDDALQEIEELPSAQQNRIAKETAGKSLDEIYDFLYWLMLDYGMQFTDSRLAVIEWMKEERIEDE